jgi:hypothetical protein
MSSGTISLLRVWSNSIPLNSEKSTTELNDPHFIEIGRLNLTLDLEIQQWSNPFKQVINIIIWIRDTWCYRVPLSSFYIQWVEVIRKVPKSVIIVVLIGLSLVFPSYKI